MRMMSHRYSVITPTCSGYNDCPRSHTSWAKTAPPHPRSILDLSEFLFGVSRVRYAIVYLLSIVYLRRTVSGTIHCNSYRLGSWPLNWLDIQRGGTPIEGTMNADLYIFILWSSLVPFIRSLYPDSHRFMQDNGPNTSRTAQQ